VIRERVRHLAGPLWIALVALLVAAAPSVAAAQPRSERSQRFSITQVGDTTITFGVGRMRWVKPKQRGVAVDASQRDALIARFRVLEVTRGVATALITGQTTRVTTAHTVVMIEPAQRWYKSGRFWTGAFVGALGGVFAGATIK